MVARPATLNDAESITNVFLTSMPDDPAWTYRFPYRLDYPEDHRKFNGDLIRRFISPEYPDWKVMVIDAQDASLGITKVVAFSIWDVTYINKREHGPSYKGRSPVQDTADAGGSTRRDSNPEHVAAFRKGLAESVAKYFHSYGQDRMNLQILATLPEFRRRGYASALVRWGMDMALQDRVALTLNASPQGSTLYKSLGFRALGTQRSQVPGEEEYVENTAMVYDAGYEGRPHRELL